MADLEDSIEARGADAVITPYELLAPSWVRGQLGTLRAAFPNWIIVYCGFAGQRWLDASRPGYSGPGPCSLVAADIPATWRALRDAATTERPIAGAVRSG